MNVETQPSDMKDLYQQITDQILEALSQHTTGWIMPWHQQGGGLPKNILTQKAYGGVNILSLWIASYKRKYQSPFWGTYKQWQTLGGQVRKGETGTLIVFYKSYEICDPAEGLEEQNTTQRFVLKASRVFNTAQVDGLDQAALPQEETPGSLERLEKAETFIAKTQAKIVPYFSTAFYHASEDIIGMPERTKFFSTATCSAGEAYYGTLFHELGHWTGHQKRLNRLVPTSRFGSESYALEELIAELTSAFLCAELGVTSSLRLDHVHYIESWLKVLRHDKRAIFYAARHASLAMAYLQQITAD